MLQKLKDLAVKTPVGAWLQNRRWLADVDRYRSRLPRDQARLHQDYLASCRRSAPVPVDGDSAVAGVARSWREAGYAVFGDDATRAVAAEIDAALRARDAADSIWDSDDVYKGDTFLDFPVVADLFRPDASLARAIRAAFGCEFKIFYCKLYRSRRTGEPPAGSQLWHADGGPGTCMNLMFALTPLTVANGAMQLLSWRDSLSVFDGERARLRGSSSVGTAYRDEVCAYYAERIAGMDPAKVRQPLGPPGTALMFSNNLIHKGGFPPEAGAERRVLVMHVYPAAAPAPIEEYLRKGLTKTASFPRDPDF